jgi:hypothetical protein
MKRLTRVLSCVGAGTVVLTGALTFPACGYALAGRGSFLPSDIRTVGIPPLDNRSTFLRVEEMLTEKIRTEFIGRGKYSVRPDAEGADAVLSGQIVGISVQPVAVTEQQIASRYLFTVSMRVQFTDTRTNAVLWSNDSLVFREEYALATLSGALEGASFLDQEGGSFDRIASDLARTVVTAILEAF